MAELMGDPRASHDWAPWPRWPDPVAADFVAADPTRPLRTDDLDRSWRLDFHHPRGVVPLAVRLLDHLVAGSQLAARETGSGYGFTARLLGTHVYYGAPDGTSPGDGIRPPDPEAYLRYSAGFARAWAGDAAKLDASLSRLEAVPAAELAHGDAATLVAYLDLALAVHQEAWRIHFATMYRLLAVHAYVLDELRALGIDEVTAAGLLQGEENAVLAGDRELRALADAARGQGLATLFELPGTGLAERLRDRPEAAAWWNAFEAFLSRHGNRGEAAAEITMPTWNEDPEPALALVRRELVEGRTHRARAAVSEVADRVRRRLDPQVRQRFETVHQLARRANFAWWNEEHNLVIDLRAHLPVRRAGLAAAAVLDLPAPDDALYLHLEELRAVLVGVAGWAELAEPAGQRREYVTRWRERRSHLPVRLGSGGDDRDPVLREILGAGTGGSVAGVVLPGLGVSPGRSRGPARVLATVLDLAEVRSGEVLVCEATSPAWTSAFDRIAGCVCEQGGMLTHAAIIAREYGVPAVCAVPGACTTISTGDLVEVDGTAGEVRVLQTVSAARNPRA
jgi:phosphohistidine swiveling domain-containing protein